MEDTQIIQLYWSRDPQAITQSKDKYGAYCFCVAHNILDSPEDAEECVNDTWLHAWNGMPPHRPQVLRMFLAKITRRVAFNRVKARLTQKRGGGQLELALEELAECLSQESPVEDQVVARELGESIRRFVRALPRREGDLFVRRYFFTEPVGTIARRYGLSDNYTTVLLSRTRKKLRQHLIKEGFIHEPTGSL